MDVSLSPELEKLIQSKLETGRYPSASEVVREALRLMDERDQLFEAQRDDMRRLIKTGMDSLRDGRGKDGEAVFDRIEAELDVSRPE